jgi:hypothetical protein
LFSNFPERGSRVATTSAASVFAFAQDLQLGTGEPLGVAKLRSPLSI